MSPGGLFDQSGPLGLQITGMWVQLELGRGGWMIVSTGLNQSRKSNERREAGEQKNSNSKQQE